MKAPIELTLYDENDQPIKTYSRSRISWGFFKKSLNARVPDDGIMTEENMNTILQFVCDFYDNQFTAEELSKGADVDDTCMIAIKIASKVVELMEKQGIKLPNAPTAAE